MQRWFLVGLVGLLAGIGCGKPAVAQKGDVIRPQLALAPDVPWPAGAKATIGILVQLHRPGQEMVYLREEQVPPEGVEMKVRLTFFEDDSPLDEPVEARLVRDC